MPNPNNDAEPVSIKLPIGMKARLQKLGKQKQRTPHWLMKEAIESYLDAEEQLEKLRKKTTARWQEAEQSLVVDSREVNAWLATWGGDDEKERPECK